MNKNVVGIGHVAYNTLQMDAMLHFYCDILGLNKAFSIKDENGNLWIEYIQIAGCQFIELFYAKEEFKPKEGTYSHLCIEVKDIQLMDKLLIDNGIDVFVRPIKQIDLNWQCWAKDPDGNPIEFMQICPESPQANAAKKL